MKKHIPNLLTLGNLLSGCIGIDLAYNGQLEYAAYCVALGAAFDFADGFVARLLRVYSDMGKQLDSLADMVTFGLLPAILTMKFLYNGPDPIPALNLVFLIPLFSAWRLAKFNIDTRQSDQFLGVPTPANAIFWASLPLVAAQRPEIAHYLDVPVILPAIFVFCFLMVSELPLFALKFKSFAWKGNEVRFVFLAATLVAVLALGYLGITLSIILYILLSFGIWVRNRNPLSPP